MKKNILKFKTVMYRGNIIKADHLPIGEYFFLLGWFHEYEINDDGNIVTWSSDDYEKSSPIIMSDVSYTDITILGGNTWEVLREKAKKTPTLTWTKMKLHET